MGRGRKKTIVGVELDFSAQLDASVAANPAIYQVTQPGRSRRSARKVVPVLTASLAPGGASVTLVLGKYDKAEPLALTVVDLSGANGAPVATPIIKL
jgi:hypothetical protein